MLRGWRKTYLIRFVISAKTKNSTTFMYPVKVCVSAKSNRVLEFCCCNIGELAKRNTAADMVHPECKLILRLLGNVKSLLSIR